MRYRYACAHCGAELLLDEATGVPSPCEIHPYGQVVWRSEPLEPVNGI